LWFKNLLNVKKRMWRRFWCNWSLNTFVVLQTLC
jgi:hypothetical protein